MHSASPRGSWHQQGDKTSLLEWPNTSFGDFWPGGSPFNDAGSHRSGEAITIVVRGSMVLPSPRQVQGVPRWVISFGLQAGVLGAWPRNRPTRASYGLPAPHPAILPEASAGPAADRAFFGNIQILRVISAFAILFVHLEAMFRIFGDPTRVVNVLRFGTDLFVIVAGFLSAHLLSGGRRSSGSYLVGRLIRIWPLYAIFTLLGFVCQHYLMHNHPVEWWQIPLDLSFIPYGVSPILYQTWTLELIMACSLVLAGCLLVSRHPVELAAAVIVGMVLAGLYYHPASPFLAFYADPAFLDFALGVLIFRLPRGRPLWAFAAICVGFVLIIVRPWDFPDVPRIHRAFASRWRSRLGRHLPGHRQAASLRRMDRQGNLRDLSHPLVCRRHGREAREGQRKPVACRRPDRRCSGGGHGGCAPRACIRGGSDHP